MYKENGKVSEALRNKRMTHDSEHTPRGNLQDGANPGKNHAIPTPASSRTGEQERSQAQAMQTPTMHTREQRIQHGPPAALPPTPEHDAMTPLRQGPRTLNREQSPQEEQNW